LKYASDQGAKFVSVRFTDLPGSWQHLTFPISELGEEQFEDGFGFDASSIRGWAAIHESDMLLVPDATRFWMDPFSEQPTLCLIGSAIDPITKEGYAFDPRSVAQRAESYLKFTGLADTAFFGPEAEFFVFDSVKFHNEQHSAATRSTPTKDTGTVAATQTSLPARISVTAFERRKATCPFRRLTRSAICVRKSR
jgi:glutamine synthetase